MKRSILAVLASLCVIHLAMGASHFAEKHPSIILISGISSSGKSSAVRELLKLEESYVSDSIDEVVLRSYDRYLMRYDPKSYEALLQFFNKDDIGIEIYGDNPPLKENAIASQANAILHQVSQNQADLIERIGGPDAYDKEMSGFYQDLLVEVAQKTVNEGKSIILDVLDAKSVYEKLRNAGFRGNIHSILLYVPYDQYLKRLESRNQRALANNDMLDIRDPLDMYSQYPTLFQLSSQPQKQSIGKISTQQAYDLLWKSSESTIKLLEHTGNSEEAKQLRRDRNQIINNMLDALGFQNSRITEGYLTPKHSYDIIINTTLTNSAGVAQSIKDQL